MPRKLDDFLRAYIEYTQNSESPVSYHTWCGIGLVSSALERRCFMEWGHTTIYPNQYIVLIGPSGRARKGEPIDIARSFLDHVGCNLIPESITREALIRRMREAMSHYQYGEKLVAQCPIVIVAEEFAVFLGENNIRLLTDMTNWYDSRKKWTYDTKHEGTDNIHGVCANVIASMAPDWIPLTLPQGVIGGGFTSRILFVVEHKKGKTIADPTAFPRDEVLERALQHDLEVIKRLKGQFYFTDEAKAAYIDWYTKEEERIERGNPALQDPRFAGYVSRRATHVKKIGMVLSSSRGGDLKLTIGDFRRARQMLERVEVNMEEVFGRVGRATYSEQTYLILEFIEQRKEVTKSELMRHFYRDVDSKMMDIIESTIHTMRLVERDTRKIEGEIVYIWKG
ncbi:hypothetical protein LCGC14_2080700 [marine sediment metagenome]|uniref:DUF3987 domain-containing protein n=1 Tax=marine sediment metagenome TaxID=412755 RepID=A0A0F9GU24_9ZZZZ